jgi:hypothetical protein
MFLNYNQITILVKVLLYTLIKILSTFTIYMGASSSIAIDSAIDSIGKAWNQANDSIELWKADMLILVNVIKLSKFWEKANRDATKATQEKRAVARLCEWTQTSVMARVMAMTKPGDPNWNKIWTQVADAATKMATDDEVQDHHDKEYNLNLRVMNTIKMYTTAVSKRAQNMNEAMANASIATKKWIQDILMETEKVSNSNVESREAIKAKAKETFVACDDIQTKYRQKFVESSNWEIKVKLEGIPAQEKDIKAIIIRFSVDPIKLYYGKKRSWWDGYTIYDYHEVGKEFNLHITPCRSDPAVGILSRDDIVVEIKNTAPLVEVTDIALFSRLYEDVSKIKVMTRELANDLYNVLRARNTHMPNKV